MIVGPSLPLFFCLLFRPVSTTREILRNIQISSSRFCSTHTYSILCSNKRQPKGHMTGATIKASPSLNDDSNPQQGTPATTTATTKRNVTVVAAATSTRALHLHNNNSNNDGDDVDVDVTVGTTNRNASTISTTNTTRSTMTMTTTTTEDATPNNCRSLAGVSTGTATPPPPLSGHQPPPPLSGHQPPQRPNPVHTTKQQQQPMKIPPTVKDIRKIFVGGLPSDGTFVVRLFCLLEFGMCASPEKGKKRP
jgi:hypothetical protein